MTTPTYRNLRSGYESGLRDQKHSLFDSYGVMMTNIQIKIISAIDANAHEHGRALTGFEQRIKAHMIYGYRR